MLNKGIAAIIIVAVIFMGATECMAMGGEVVPFYNELIGEEAEFYIDNDGKSTLIISASSSESGSWTLSAVLQKKSGSSWVSVATFSERYSRSTWIVFSKTKNLNSRGTYRFKYTITHNGSTKTGYSYTDSY
ncbi:MAG: hypothetical protein Q4Q17_00735 [Tissierellia bacterium]|nr:hypothetical protein [Tissierellia bacterium]